MNPALIQAIASSAQVGGEGISNAVSMIQNRRLNRERMEFAKSAHQIEVADLKAAGLNPILGFAGSGATAPNLTAGEFRAPSFANAGEKIVAAKKASSEMNVLAEQIAAMKSQQQLNSAMANKATKELGLIDETINRTRQETAHSAAQTRGQQIENEVLDARANPYRGYGARITPWVDKLSQLIPSLMMPIKLPFNSGKTIQRIPDRIDLYQERKDRKGQYMNDKYQGKFD